jgi:hypothetical protein
VRREERDAVEQRHGLVNGSVPKGPVFQQLNDYGEVRLNGPVFYLGPIQARIVKQPHRAALTDQPWQSGTELLEGARLASIKLADVFKSKRHWRRLIESDGREKYRLRLLSNDPPPKARQTAPLSGVGRRAIPP